MRSNTRLSKADELRFSLIRKNLIELMRDNGLSATQLAKKCRDPSGKQCFTTSTITRFLKNDAASLRNATVKALANFFNVPVDAFTNQNLLKFSGLAEVHEDRINTIPLLTGRGALTNLSCFKSWGDYPEIDPKCETNSLIPPPPISSSALRTHAGLFAFQI